MLRICVFKFLVGALVKAVISASVSLDGSFFWTFIDSIAFVHRMELLYHRTIYKSQQLFLYTPVFLSLLHFPSYFLNSIGEAVAVEPSSRYVLQKLRKAAVRVATNKFTFLPPPLLHTRTHRQSGTRIS